MNQIELFNKLKPISAYADKLEKNNDTIDILLADDHFDFSCTLNLTDNTGEYSIEWNYHSSFSDFPELIEGHSVDLDLDEEERVGYAYHYHNLENHYENVIDDFNNKNSNISHNSIEKTLAEFNRKLYGYIKNGMFEINTKVSSILYSTIKELQKSPYAYVDGATDVNTDENLDYIKNVIILPKYSADIKEECGITRSDDEIKNILKSILARGVNNISEKQRKYLVFAQKTYETIK